jgi:hypothetical protein
MNKGANPTNLVGHSIEAGASPWFGAKRGAEVNSWWLEVEVSAWQQTRSPWPRTIPPFEKSRCAPKGHSGYVMSAGL